MHHGQILQADKNLKPKTIEKLGQVYSAYCVRRLIYCNSLLCDPQPLNLFSFQIRQYKIQAKKPK